MQNQPVYYDFGRNEFYTRPARIGSDQSSFWQLANMWPSPSSNRTYLNDLNNRSRQSSSQIQQMMANRQPYQYNAPNAQQMFPGIGNPMMGGMPSQGNSMLGGGLFGAGRFLGGNYANQAGLLGTSVSGT